MAITRALILETDTDGREVGRVELDCYINELHGITAEATQHAVERGAAVADHVRPGQQRLSIEAVVSNTPIRAASTHMAGASGEPRDVQVDTRQLRQSFGETTQGVRRLGRPAFPFVRSGLEETTTKAGVKVLKWSGKFDRVRGVYETVHSMVERGALVTVQTSLRPYHDMVLTNLSSPRNAQSGNATTFTFEAVQLRLVSTQTVQALDGRPKVGTKNRGTQAKKKEEPSAPVAKKSESLAHKSDTVREVFGHLADLLHGFGGG